MGKDTQRKMSPTLGYVLWDLEERSIAGPREATSSLGEGSAFKWKGFFLPSSSPHPTAQGLAGIGLGRARWGLVGHPRHKIFKIKLVVNHLPGIGTMLWGGVWTLVG